MWYKNTYLLTISRGNLFYVYILLSGLISMFLHVECIKISCGLQPTRFFPYFFMKLYCYQKSEISDLFLGEIIYVIKRVP